MSGGEGIGAVEGEDEEGGGEEDREVENNLGVGIMHARRCWIRITGRE
jgi:hypothetical protein